MQWITKELVSVDALLLVATSSIVMYFAVILAVRINGLRSFSKMSAFDFAMTIAVGTVLSSTMLSKSTTLSEGLVAVAMLFALQAFVAFARSRFRMVHRVVDNAPTLLMNGNQIQEKNLRRAKLTHDDLRAKLRAAGVSSRTEVAAVILETTGDVSVIRRTKADENLSEISWILDDVRPRATLKL